MSSQAGASAEALPLPKGGGSTRGLGDGFSADFNRGTGTYSIEIELPKGHRDLGPKLVLSYNSGNGDGPFGLGWALALPIIQIDTDRGVADYSGPDYLMGGESLVSLGGGAYRQRVENGFPRIRQLDGGWEVTDKSGILSRLGTSDDSRVRGEVGGAERVFAWTVEEIRDTSDNRVRFTYRRDGGQLYPSRIEYAIYQVRFEYEQRPDPSVNRRPGFAVEQGLRCRSIEVRHPAGASPVIRRYRFEYLDEADAPSRLGRVTMEGFKRQTDGSVVSTEAPGLELSYSEFRPSARRFQRIGDDLLTPPGPLGEGGRELVDLGGDALPDVVRIAPGGGSTIWRNLGEGRLAPPQTLPDFPSPMNHGTTTTLFDTDGSGTADLLQLRRDQISYYPNRGDGSFDRPRFLGGRAPLSLDFNRPDTTFADLDGDGRVDLVQSTERGLLVWHNRGGDEGFEVPRAIPRGADRDLAPDVRVGADGVFFTDMTGDGLPDVVHVHSGMVEYWPSLGGGRYDRRRTMERPPVLPRHHQPERLFLADVDGTGSADVVYVGDSEVSIWRNLGGRRFADPIVVRGTPRTTAAGIRLVDLLGRGTAGVLWSDVQAGPRSGYRFLSLSEVKPHLLSAVREGVGLETRIEYGSSAAHAARDEAAGQVWTTRLPIPVPVVDRIVEHDLVSGSEETNEIFYHDGRWDPAARRFRGFGRVTVQRAGGGGAEEAFEEHRFLVGAPGEPALGDGAIPETDLDRARRGQIVRSTYFSAGPDSPALRVEHTRWRVEVVVHGEDGTPVLYPQVTGTEVHNSEGGEHPRVVTTTYRYDAVGNVIEEQRRAGGPAGDDAGQPVAPLEVVTRMQYAANEIRYVVDRLARTTRLDGNGNVLGEIRHYYDGPDRQGLPLGQVDRGLMRRQEVLVLTLAEAAATYGADAPDWAALGYHQIARSDGAPSWAIDQTRLAYTATGMVARRVDPMGAETSFDYGADGLLVTRVSNAAGHARTAGYDLGFQVIEEQTEPGGGATRYHYDGLGRVIRVVRAGDSDALPTLRYRHDHVAVPNSVRIEKRRTPGAVETYDKAIYFDGKGRPIQRRNRLEGDRVRVSGVLELNARGEPIAKGLPLFRNGLGYEEPAILPAAPRFTYRYDGIGRLVEAINPEGLRARTAYTPWTAELSDPLDNDPLHPHAETPRVQRFDAFGRLVGVTLVREDGTRPTVTYRYDLLGRIVASTDLEGRAALRSVTYDGRGSKLVIGHAAAGTRTAVYDARGRLVRYWDDRRQPVARTYDAIGRQLSESVDGAVEETYHYDLAGQEALLGRVEDAGGSVVFTYDARRRVVSKDRQILGSSFRVEYGYDASGLLSSQSYPDGNQVSYTRWGDGRLRAISGVIDRIDYNESALPTRLAHTNGVEETLDYSAAGFLTGMRWQRAGTTLYDASHTRDAVGRLTRLEQSAGPDAFSQSFEHDALSRLTASELDRAGSVTRWQFDHDADGNLLSSDEMDVAGYDYDFARPGAVTRRNLTDGTVDDIAFDAAGHLETMAGDRYEFDPRGRLERVARADGTTVTMTYDYRGARIAKQVAGPGGNFAARYVDEVFEQVAGVSNCYVMANGRLVGRLRGTGRRHLHSDHRGSVVTVTRPGGAVDGRGWFGPFGHLQTEADAGGSRHYAGAVFDPETGLYYMNHRYYSPALGRFVSPDPLYLAKPERQLDVPEGHNLYVYANSSPVDYVDPTGQGFWETFGKVLAAIVVVAAVVAAVVVAVAVLAAAGPLALLGAGIGALIGGIADGWQGAALGAMMGMTIGINLSLAGPLGIVTFLGVFPGIRKQDWYQSLAGWTSWLMPASWPGHIMGLGVFLGNGIAHVFGSDKQIESVKFDWKHGQILTAGGEYGGHPFPWLGMDDAPAHNIGGFTFIANDFWESSGGTWEGVSATLEHETGHMLSNAAFGFWQGIINGIENLTTEEHDDRFFEKIAESNVNESDRDASGDEVPFWH